MKKLRALALLLALCLALLSGCGTGPSAGGAPVEEDGEQSAEEPEETDPLEEGEEDEQLPPDPAEEDLEDEPEEDEDEAAPDPPPDVPAHPPEVYGLHHQAAALTGDYPDVVGWLYIPGTLIDQVVVQGEDNQFYTRRDWMGNTSFNGCYFADWRALLGGGSVDDLSRNTVVYGHSMSENPDGNLFDQLKRYWSPAFAAENPYIYFSTTELDLCWEVFAVLVGDVSVPYNLPNMDQEDFEENLAWLLKESIYDLGVSVGADDRILTLSTTDFSIVPSYPNDYRFVVAARLVERY